MLINCNKKLREKVFAHLGKTIYTIANKRLNCSETNVKRLLATDSSMSSDLWNLALTLFVFDKYHNQILSYENVVGYNTVVGCTSDLFRNKIISHVSIYDSNKKLQNVHILNRDYLELPNDWIPDELSLTLLKNMGITKLITYSPSSENDPLVFSLDKTLSLTNAQKIAGQYSFSEISEALKISFDNKV